jgi:hypothetical protein
LATYLVVRQGSFLGAMPALFAGMQDLSNLATLETKVDAQLVVRQGSFLGAMPALFAGMQDLRNLATLKRRLTLH